MLLSSPSNLAERESSKPSAASRAGLITMETRIKQCHCVSLHTKHIVKGT